MARRRYLFVVAVGYLASVAAYARLPRLADPGAPDLRPLVAFLLPTTAALTYALARRVWDRDTIRAGDETFEPSYDAIFFAVVLFVVTLHLLVVGTLAGIVPPRQPWLLRGTLVLLGLAMVRIGNLLPRTRPNLVFGIRTTRTLTNRALWMQMHRVAGYVTVALGTVVVVSATLLARPRIEHVLGTSMLVAATVLLVSYVRYSHVASARS